MTEMTLRTPVLTDLAHALLHSRVVAVAIACAHGLAALFLGSGAIAEEAGIVV